MKRLTNSGETIVEVLIVTLILTSVMATLFALTTQTLNQDRASQERTEAASYAQDQVERLVAATSNGTITEPPATKFCLIDVPDPSVSPVLPVPSVIPITNVPQACWSNRYIGYFAYDAVNKVYTETVTWDNATNTGQDNIKIHYRTEYARGGAPVVPPIIPPVIPPGPCPPEGIPTGALQACYYNDESFGAFALNRNENPVGSPNPNPNATNVLFNDFGAGSPSPAVNTDSFSARYQGKFNFAAGTYTFTAGSNDGFRLYIDGDPNPISQDWGIPHTYRQNSVNFTIAIAGLHTVRLDFYEHQNVAKVTLSWVQALPLVLEGETFTPADVGNYAIPDAAASAGAVMRLLSEGGVTKTVNTPAFRSVVIRARGDMYQGPPKMTLYIDGDRVMNGAPVTVSSYGDYSFNTNSYGPGSHTFILSFDNDNWCGPLCPDQDRNLYFDKITLVP
jgi:type II secretory pathway pseudopilin PulG